MVSWCTFSKSSQQSEHPNYSATFSTPSEKNIAFSASHFLEQSMSVSFNHDHDCSIKIPKCLLLQSWWKPLNLNIIILNQSIIICARTCVLNGNLHWQWTLLFDSRSESASEMCRFLMALDQWHILLFNLKDLFATSIKWCDTKWLRRVALKFYSHASSSLRHIRGLGWMETAYTLLMFEGNVQHSCLAC